MRQNLRIPGPTPLPAQVQAAMHRDMIDHRGPEFANILNQCTESLKYFYCTKGDVLIFPASGTGGLEAAIVNTLSPRDPVLAVSIGVFGDRFAKIAETFGLDVRRVSIPKGRAVDPEQLRQALDENPDVKAVLITHNETSTGVTNPLKDLATIVKERNLLLLVDAVSSMGAIPVLTDEWGLDVVVSGSQKAWMIPPGMVMVSVSERAWQAVQAAKLPRYYWDFRAAKSSLEKGQTPYTPAVSLFYALEVALDLMMREGREAIWERHAEAGVYTRNRIKEMGLELFADERYASNTVTAIKVPEGIDGKAFKNNLRDKHGVIVGGGQAELSGRIIRLGHLGYFTKEDISAACDAIQMELESLKVAP